MVEKQINTIKENNFKQTEIGLIPEDWEVVRLGEVAEIQQGKTPKRHEYDDLTRFRIIKVKDFEDGEKVKLNVLGERSFTKVDLGERYQLKKGDSLVLSAAHSSEIVGQKVGYFDWNTNNKVFFVAELLRVRANPSKLIPYFCFLILNYNLVRNQIKEQVKGGHLYARDLKKILIPLPPLPEQQKIAKVLDKIQQAIEIQDRIIEQAKNLKKSLMQKLFTEGLYGEEQKETEIGLIPKSWEVVRLGDMCKVVRGGSPRPKGDPRYFSSTSTGIHWIKISDLSKYKSGKYIINTDEFLTEEGKRKSRYLERGTLVLTNSGTIGIPAILGINGCIHDGFIAFLNLNEKIINKEFLYYVFEKSHNILEKLAPRGTQANLNTTILKSFQIPLPPLEEQKQIAHILSTVDRKIEVEQKRKQVLKELFKTMLHKLMSGEIRLKEVEI